MKVARIKELLRQIAELERELEREVKEQGPVGGGVAWNYQGREQRGEVVMQGYHGRLRVKNGRTGRELWVEPAALIGEDGGSYLGELTGGSEP